jgi:hypothetical protein
MSTLEKKAIAFEQLAAISNEADLDEILLYLKSLATSKPAFDTDAFFEEASNKYDDVLQKLAQ